jgi:hypothetical protein
MIEVEEQSEELLTVRVRPRVSMLEDEKGPTEDHQQGWRIHIAEQEICPTSRSHPWVWK